MEKRAVIAVVVSILILVLYQEVVLRYVYPPPPPGEEQVETPPLEPNAPSPAAEGAAAELSTPPSTV